MTRECPLLAVTPSVCALVCAAMALPAQTNFGAVNIGGRKTVTVTINPPLPH